MAVQVPAQKSKLNGLQNSSSSNIFVFFSYFFSFYLLLFPL